MKRPAAAAPAEGMQAGSQQKKRPAAAEAMQASSARASGAPDTYYESWRREFGLTRQQYDDLIQRKIIDPEYDYLMQRKIIDQRSLQQKREQQTTSGAAASVPVAGASAPAPIVGHGLWVRDPHDPPDDAEGLARIGFLTKCDVCRNPVLPNGTRCFRFFGVPYYFHFNCLASKAGQQLLADMRRASEV